MYCTIINSIGETENLRCGSAHITTDIESKKLVKEESTIKYIETDNDMLINAPFELKILNVKDDECTYRVQKMLCFFKKVGWS